MKICFMANVQSYHTLKYAKYFERTGHELTIITFEKPLPEFNETTARIIKLNLKKFLLTLPVSVLGLRNKIKKINPDVIHAHYIMKYGFLSMITGFHPIVNHAWGTDINTKYVKNPVYRYLLRKCFNYSDALIAGNKHLAESMITLGASSEKISVIPWGIDTERNNPQKRNKENLSQFDFSENNVVLSTRKFEKIYDIPTFIKAIPEIVKNHPDTRFLLLGGGSEKQAIKDLIQELGITDFVHITDFIENDQVPDIIASCHIYVQTSLTDGGLAISCKEAMASELPAVISDIDVNKVITDGVTGFLFPVGDSEKISEIIVKLLEDKKLREKIGKDSRNFVVENYEYDRLLDSQVELYKKLK